MCERGRGREKGRGRERERDLTAKLKKQKGVTFECYIDEKERDAREVFVAFLLFTSKERGRGEGDKWGPEAKICTSNNNKNKIKE